MDRLNLYSNVKYVFWLIYSLPLHHRDFLQPGFGKKLGYSGLSYNPESLQNIFLYHRSNRKYGQFHLRYYQEKLQLDNPGPYIFLLILYRNPFHHLL